MSVLPRDDAFPTVIIICAQANSPHCRDSSSINLRYTTPKMDLLTGQELWTLQEIADRTRHGDIHMLLFAGRTTSSGRRVHLFFRLSTRAGYGGWIPPGGGFYIVIVYRDCPERVVLTYRVNGQTQLALTHQTITRPVWRFPPAGDAVSSTDSNNDDVEMEEPPQGAQQQEVSDPEDQALSSHSVSSSSSSGDVQCLNDTPPPPPHSQEPTLQQQQQQSFYPTPNTSQSSFVTPSIRERPQDQDAEIVHVQHCIIQ